nr:MAG TPA: N-acetylglucosamine-1-phosphotransferase subunits alpha/beta [Caudoviricetes sp.]
MLLCKHNLRYLESICRYMALCNGKSCGYGFIEFHKGILRYKTDT